MKLDRGATALAERTTAYWANLERDFGTVPEAILREATAVIGTTGLFIPDVTKHEPVGALDRALQPFVTCSCGWNAYGKSPDREFFDHIGALS